MKTVFKAILVIVAPLFAVLTQFAFAKSGPDIYAMKPVILTDARDKYPLGLYLRIKTVLKL